MAPADRTSDSDMPPVWLTAFWSYVHRDNASLRGKIAELREDICNLYSFQTGQNLRVFFDREDIGWGQNWDLAVKSGIEQAVFMIPIVTANYFNSEYCRGELLDFNTLCRAGGIGEELILPIVFSGAELISRESNDEVAKILSRAQYENFSEVWPYMRGSQEWTLAARRVVRRLIEAERRIADRLSAVDVRSPSTSSCSESRQVVDDLSEEEPGTVDILGRLQEALEDATLSLGGAVGRLRELSAVLRESKRVLTVDSRTGIHQIQRKLLEIADEVRSPAVAFETAAAQALGDVTTADIVVTQLKHNLDGYSNSEFAQKARQSFEASFGALVSVREVERGIDPILNQMADLERLSVVLRRDLQPARRGFRFIRDAARLVLSWGTEGNSSLAQGVILDG